VLECVVNISEGRDLVVIEAIAASAGRDLLDVHHDPHHHRAVLTLIGEAAPRAVARAAVARLTLVGHDGVHPRLGVVDVVPFVPLEGSDLADAVVARDRYAAWSATELGVPCFCYGPEITLPEVRRRAFRDLGPTTGATARHPTAGATCVGARPVLVAYNVWLATNDVELAGRLAAAVRCPQVRALGLQVGDRVQVSMNLIAPHEVGPATAFDRVAALTTVAGGELVGLVPEHVLRAIPPTRWAELGLADDATIEARLARRG
jgi:glutamate formiminotransferase